MRINSYKDLNFPCFLFAHLQIHSSPLSNKSYQKGSVKSCEHMWSKTSTNCRTCCITGRVTQMQRKEQSILFCTRACRCPHLSSVTLLDRGVRVRLSSHTESMAIFAPLVHGHRCLWQKIKVSRIEQQKKAFALSYGDTPTSRMDVFRFRTLGPFCFCNLSLFYFVCIPNSSVQFITFDFT